MSIIDSPHNCEEKISALKSSGVNCIIRYYNHKNTKTFPKKCLTQTELKKIHDAGLKAAVVFQQRQNQIADFDEEKGKRAGLRAAELAISLGQPAGSCIYFSADFDTDTAAKVNAVVAFFKGAKKAMAANGGSQYVIGAYSCGKTLDKLKSLGLAEKYWVSLLTGHSGSKEFRASNEWHLDQKKTTKIADYPCDLNNANAGLPDFGAF